MLWPCETGLSPPPVIYYWPFQGGASVVVYSSCQCLSAFCLCVLFMIAWWPSAGKELSFWLFACAVLLYIVLIVCFSFPFGVWGICDCIDSWLWDFVITSRGVKTKDTYTKIASKSIKGWGGAGVGGEGGNEENKLPSETMTLPRTGKQIILRVYTLCL